MNDRLEQIKRELLCQIEKLPVIDGHEHMAPERFRLEQEVDVFTLFTGYTRGDLRVAGMTGPQYAALFDRSVAPACRWELFEPYWQRIRHSGYSQAILLAVRKLFGVEDLNAGTAEAVSRAMAEHNRPGLYDRVFDACGIRAALTQWGSTETGNPRLIPLMPMPFFSEYGCRWASLAQPLIDNGAFRPVVEAADSRMVWPAFPEGAVINTLDDYLGQVHNYLRRVKSGGAVGVKLAAKASQAPNRAEALALFGRLRDGADQTLPDSNALKDYVTDLAVGWATELGLPIAVHAGYWGDFRQLNPTHIIPLLQRHPKARFDLYHLGYPYVREALMLGKTFANVWLNLCWVHVISPLCAFEALDEALDLVPVNKITGFGGDYALPVEKIAGHLELARRNIAGALAGRLEDCRMTEAQAMDVARLWLFDNPKELYRLEVGE